MCDTGARVMAHTTVFAHTKGGTGKTTACVNVAGFLSQQHLNVLLVDADPQGHASANLGVSDEHIDESLYDLVLDAADIRETDTGRCVYPTASGVDIIPAAERLHEAYSMVWDQDERNEVIEQAIEPFNDQYDHILIDTPSTHLQAIAGGIRAADSFYLVLDSSIFAQEGAQALKRFLRRLPDRHEVAMNPTRVLFVEQRNRNILDQLKAVVSGPDEVQRSERVARALFGTRFTKIPYCENVLQSQRRKVPLSHFETVPEEAGVFEELAQDLEAHRQNGLRE